MYGRADGVHGCYLPNAREPHGRARTITAKARWFVVRFQTEFWELISLLSRDVLRDFSAGADFDAAVPKAALLRLKGPVVPRYEAKPDSRNAFLIFT